MKDKKEFYFMLKMIKYVKNTILFIIGIILIPFVFFDILLYNFFKSINLIKNRIKKIYYNEN
ncbi:MAG: hypothetical protein JXB50_09710 [Spirochaetes bacterium]|nr:hypothetical protein [Spirochaetota bacterium]